MVNLCMRKSFRYIGLCVYAFGTFPGFGLQVDSEVKQV